MENSETAQTIKLTRRPGHPPPAGHRSGTTRHRAKHGRVVGVVGPALHRATDLPARGLPWFVPAATCLLSAAAALAVDCPLARWCVGDHCPDGLAKLLAIVEPFGHGLGVLVVGVLIHQLDPLRRWALPRLAVMSFVAGLGANGLKLIVSRARPIQFSFEGGVADTFGQWWPLVADSGSQSFPSAHTATAVALAAALIWLYPRGRWVFVGLAVLVACQRLESGYHYLSDTLCGAAVGLLVARVCLRNPKVAPLFERLESYLMARQMQKAMAPRTDWHDRGSDAEPADDEVQPLAA